MSTYPAGRFRLRSSTPPATTMEEACARLRACARRGHILAFLPGAPEIRRARSARRVSARRSRPSPPGSSYAEEQDPASPRRGRSWSSRRISRRRRSPFRASRVIDSGLHKVRALRSGARRPAGNRADLRGFRRSTRRTRGTHGAGRGPAALGRARSVAAPSRAGNRARRSGAAALEILAWGGDPRTFAWFEAPPAEALSHAAFWLLGRLGRADESGPDDGLSVGRDMRQLPLHPRLARLLLHREGRARGRTGLCPASPSGTSCPRPADSSLRPAICWRLLIVSRRFRRTSYTSRAISPRQTALKPCSTVLPSIE